MRKMCAGEEKNLQIQEKSINWKNVWKLEEKRVMAGLRGWWWGVSLLWCDDKKGWKKRNLMNEQKEKY